MSKTLREMLVGILLGDAHIHKVGLDKAFISFEQSKKKNWLYKLCLSINERRITFTRRES